MWDQEIRNLLVRVQPTGRKAFYCAYRTKGNRRSRVRIGDATVLTISDAREHAQRILVEVINGGDPALERRRTQIVSFRQFLSSEYGPWVLSHRKSGRITLKRLNSVFSFILDRKLSEITPWLIEKWRSERKVSGIAVNTINRDVIALRAALSKALEWGLLQDHPLKKLRMLKTSTGGVVRYLSVDEERCIRLALVERDECLRRSRNSANEWRRARGYSEFPAKGLYADHLHPIVILALNTGMRRGEILDLTWDNVSFSSRIVTIAAATTKSGQARHIPLNHEARSALEHWHNQRGRPENGLVFPNDQGGRMDNFTTAWKRLLKRANITNFRFHDTRHHVASCLVMSGVDLNTVREILGHADIKMTLRYSHLSPQIRAAAVEKLADRNRTHSEAASISIENYRSPA